MQSTGNGVAGLLMKLQEEVLGYSVVVPLHANCHRADLAFRDAMDDTHEFGVRYHARCGYLVSQRTHASA